MLKLIFSNILFAKLLMSLLPVILLAVSTSKLTNSPFLVVVATVKVVKICES